MVHSHHSSTILRPLLCVFHHPEWLTDDEGVGIARLKLVGANNGLVAEFAEVLAVLVLLLEDVTIDEEDHGASVVSVDHWHKTSCEPTSNAAHTDDKCTHGLSLPVVDNRDLGECLAVTGNRRAVVVQIVFVLEPIKQPHPV